MALAILRCTRSRWSARGTTPRCMKSATSSTRTPAIRSPDSGCWTVVTMVTSRVVGVVRSKNPVAEAHGLGGVQ